MLLFADDRLELQRAFDNRVTLVNHYVDAYRNYCWPVNSIDDIKLAPFHVLASEGAVHVDKTHVWHMETLGELCNSDPVLLLETPFRTARLGDTEATNALITWRCRISSVEDQVISWVGDHRIS